MILYSFHMGHCSTFRLQNNEPTLSRFLYEILSHKFTLCWTYYSVITWRAVFTFRDFQRVLFGNYEGMISV
jgi:hypothetical protein